MTSSGGVARLAMALVVLAAACSASTKELAVDPPVDGGNAADSSVSEAGTTDGAMASCEGACRSTSIRLDFGEGRGRTLLRAQFGVQTVDGGSSLHAEIHLGGAPACPTSESPTPDYTLVASAIPRTLVGTAATDADGVTAAVFDFKGDLGLPPVTRATRVDLTNVVVDPAAAPAWIAFDLKAQFPEGRADGHVYAAFCESLGQ